MPSHLNVDTKYWTLTDEIPAPPVERSHPFLGDFPGFFMKQLGQSWGGSGLQRSSMACALYLWLMPGGAMSAKAWQSRLWARCARTLS